MPTLTVREQRKVAKALPKRMKVAAANKVVARARKGQGGKGFISDVGKAFGSVGKALGPTVLKEIVLPLARKKISGKGLKLAGSGTSLAGGAKKKRRKR